jgi:hypothetical protein
MHLALFDNAAATDWETTYGIRMLIPWRGVGRLESWRLEEKTGEVVLLGASSCNR